MHPAMLDSYYELFELLEEMAQLEGIMIQHEIIQYNVPSIDFNLLYPF